MPSLVLGGVTDLDQDKILKDTIIASNLSKSDIQELRNTMDTTADLRESNVIDLQQVTQCDVDSFVGENNSSSTLFRNDCSRYSMDSNLNGTYSLSESSDEEDYNRNAFDKGVWVHSIIIESAINDLKYDWTK